MGVLRKMKNGNGIKIVYLIMAHSNPDQLKKLIEKLDYKNNSFVIHFDLNCSNNDYNELKEIFKGKNNVYYSKRNRCYWGDISLVDASIDCLKTAYENQVNFNYAVLLSGQHLPIKSNEYIENILRINDNKNYINYFKLPADVWANQAGGMDRIIYYHFNKHPRKRYSVKKIINRGCSLLLRKLNVKINPPIDIDKFYGGSQWWCLTNECCIYILNFIKERPDVYKYFKNVLIPDEIFFQTILVNSKYSDTLINHNFNYIDWGSVPSASPLTLEESHYHDLKKSSNLWARKFDVNKSIGLIQLLEDNLYNES